MRRWAVVIFIVVVVTALMLGGSFVAISSLLPDTQQQSILPFIGAIAITVVLANTIVATMQWLGISPLDYLPEKTLREKDPSRFKLSRSKDPNILAENADRSLKLKEYDWAKLFAEAWVSVRPGELRAYRDLAVALGKLNQPDRLKEIGSKMTSLHKLDYNGYAILGEAHSQLAEWEEARKWYEQALLYASDNFRFAVLIELSEVYEALGLVDKAMEVLQELILDPEPVQKAYYSERLQHLEQIAARQAQSSGST